MKSTKVFRSGGSYAVRLPKAWVPPSGRVVLRREANRIIITEEGADFRELATQFAKDGPLDFERPSQPLTDPVKEL
jgi:virulence-associated protein VagC